MADLREKYKLLKMYEELVDELSEGKYPNATREAIEKCKQLLAEHKREYRNWLRKEDENKYLYPNKYGKIVAGGGDFDSRWMKVFFPDEQWSEEDKQEFVEENWKHYKPTYYDCTGQIFTTSIRVFNVPSGVVAYIMEAMDV